MNYRPYPDVDRALAQLERGRVREPVQVVTLLADTTALEAALRRIGEALRPRQTGKAAITAAIVDEAVKAGEHVHVAGRDGVRCAGGDDACSVPSKEPDR
ncbi:hypothetical protein [Streptomyces sp. KR55]|uniref:hypothetical protein n=1 Tax=Streptomyces sp. KR55 TaxID=3457425 RepID=UPI003FD4EED9